MSLNLPDPNRAVGDSGHTSDTNLIIDAINTVKSQVDAIPAGPQGPQGEPGAPGAPGVAATITVAGTITTNPGADAQVVESGTAQNKALTFYIPRGQQGPAGSQGPQGPIGPPGTPGAPGATGSGVKPGGLEGQVLTKASNNDFDTAWEFPGSAPVTSVDGRVGPVTLNDLYDAAGSAAAAQAAAEATAEAYADSLAPNYDPAGSAASAQAAAEAYADSLAPNYDPAGSASAAQSAAEAYADSLAPNYDPAGSAAAAQSAAEGYADSLAVNYDPAGSASSAQAAAESYADGLAVNYDAAGSAASAQAAAESYADGVAAAAQTAAEDYADSLAANYDPAGSAAAVAGDLSAHEGATTSVHGISDTADLVYTNDARLSDARTPTAHASTHESGGTDELELAPNQITGTAIVSGDVHLITFVTSSTRPSSPTEGMIIYETDTNLYYGWKGSAWSPIGGGATGGGTDDVFYENAQTVTANYTITSNKNAMSAGPITIDSGVTVTVPSGSVWTVV